MPTPSEDTTITDVATAIADALHETKHGPRAQIWRIVRELGSEQARLLLTEVQSIEAGDGILTPDGAQRRTPGGVFFFLASQRLSANARNRVFYYRQHVKQSVQANATKAASATADAPVALPITWADRLTDRDALMATPGEASVTMILIGHPLERHDAGTANRIILPPITLPPLPKGLPLPDVGEHPAPSTFLTSKQWKSNAMALAISDAILVLEGVGGATPTQDVLFFTMSAITKRRHRTKDSARLKVTATGRLGIVIAKGTYVATLLTMSHLPALPKGLPITDKALPIQALVFIATKQWEALGASSEADAVIITGFGVPEPDLPGFIVFATQIAHRQAAPHQRDRDSPT